MKGGLCVVWDQWVVAVKWDEATNSRKVHYKVTSVHLFPDSSEKNAKSYPEEMLNKNMLNLMKHNRNSLRNGSVLDSTVEFLETTSDLISQGR